MSADDALELFDQTAPRELQKVKNKIILDSSLRDINSESSIHGQNSGFVQRAIEAYNGHHHLEIRLDDVWLAILAQLNIYIHENSDKLREMLVDHASQVHIEVDLSHGVRGSGAYDVDWAKVSMKMIELIDANIKSDIRDWLILRFTTTTETDKFMVSILLMSTMKKYFTYEGRLMCGLQSVTLLGEKTDWERLASIAENLSTFGPEEPTAWYGLLKPVLARFVTSFDAPKAKETKDFWQNVPSHYYGGSGPTYLSGFITAFCFWDSEGHFVHTSKNIPKPDSGETKFLRLDDAVFHHIENRYIPPG